jgi:hypothetical protein
VILLGAGLWWFLANTTPNDAMTPTPSASNIVSPSASASPRQPNCKRQSSKHYYYFAES